MSTATLERPATGGDNPNGLGVAPMDERIISIEPQGALEHEIYSPTRHDWDEHVARAVARGVVVVPLSALAPNPFQPRKKPLTPEEIEELATQIKIHGLLQTLLVRPLALPGQWQLIAGHRRLAALKLLQSRGEYSDSLIVGVRRATDCESLELAIEENVRRQNFNPLDEALAYAALEKLGRTQNEIASRFSLSQGAVSNRIRLLNLPLVVREMLAAEELTASHGIALLSFNGNPMVMEFAQRAVKGRWSVSDLEAEVKAFVQAEEDRLSPQLPIGEDRQLGTEDDAQTDDTDSEPRGAVEGEPDEESSDTESSDEESADSETEETPEPIVEKSTAPFRAVPGAVPKNAISKNGSTPAASKVASSIEAKPAQKKELFAVGDKVQWNAGESRKPKWQTGEVAEVGGALFFVQPSGTNEAKQRKSFQKKNCILKAWDGKSKPGFTSTEITPVKTAKEIADEKSKSTPQSSSTTSTPTAAPRKAPDGMTATYAPTEELFFCEDNGLAAADVFKCTKRLVMLAAARSITADEYLTALESE